MSVFRNRLMRWGLFGVVALACAIAVAKVREKQEEESNRASLSDLIRAAQLRLSAAIFERETVFARTVPAGPLIAERVAERAARVEHLEQALRSAAAETTWEAKLAQSRLQSLVAARDTLELQASVDWHRFAAEVDHEIARLNEVASRAGAPQSILPENELELLRRADLQELRSAYSRSLLEWEKRSALSPQGILDHPMEQLKARLAKVDKALDVPTFDVSERFAKLPQVPKRAPQISAWIEQSAEVRAAAVDRREQELLKKSLAIDDTNVAAELRLAELERGGVGRGVAETAARRQARLVMERARGFSPDLRSRTAAEMIKNRFADPVRAIESEALMTRQWEQLRLIEDPAMRRLLLPGKSDQSVLRWAVAHMNEEDLGEAMTYARAARDRLSMIRAERSTLLPGQEHLHYDVELVNHEIEAITDELSIRRANGGRPSVPQLEPGMLDKQTRELVGRHAAETTADLAKTSEGRQALYEAHQRYLARVDEPIPAVAERVKTLHVDGLRDEVEALIADAKEYRRFRVEVTERGLSMPSGPKEAEFSEGLAKAGKALEARADRLKQGVKAVSQLDSAVQKELSTRIDRAMVGMRGPPPDSVEAVANLGGSEGWPRPSGGPAPTAPTRPPGPGGPPRQIQALLGPERGNVASSVPIGRPGLNGNAAAANLEARASGAVSGSRVPSTVQPYGDPLVAKMKVSYNSSMDSLRGALNSVRTTPLVAAETPNVAFDIPQPIRTIRATVGQRPGLPGWMTRAKTAVPFSDIIKLKSTRILPGGVALGMIPKVDGSWADAGLLYEKTTGRLVLLSESGERLEFPQVDPTILKTCYLFSRSPDPVATSIGYAGEGAPEHLGAISKVLLHPQLRDTRIGLDVIDADRLAWALGRDRLPNGVPNPVFGEMRSLVSAASNADLPVQPLLDQLAKIEELNTSVTGAERVRRRVASALKLLEGTPFNYQATAVRAEVAYGEAAAAAASDTLMLLLVGEMRSTEWSPWQYVCAAALLFGARPENVAKNQRELAIPYLQFVDSTRLSLLTDDRLSVAKRKDGFDFDSRLRIRYVHGRIEFGSDGLRRMDEVVEVKDAGDKATELIPRLEPIYPSLRKTREYAEWIGLMRWAQEAGHVAWLDLADLRPIQHSNDATPDYLIRGSPREMTNAAELFGLNQAAN